MSAIVPVFRVTRLTSPRAAWPARLGALILIAQALLPNAQATTIGCTDGVGDSAALIAAIDAANANGGDTLDLGAGCVYGFGAANNFWYGPNALPPIASTITIRGHGARLQATHVDTTAANGFRFFYVSGGMQLPAGELRLDHLTIADGYARGGDSSFGGSGAGMGGAVFNQGTLALDSVTLTGNVAQGGGGNTSGNIYGGAGMGQDGQFYTGGGFGGSLGASYGGNGGVAGSGGGGGGGGFLAGADGANGNAAAGGVGGGLGRLGSIPPGDGGSGGDVGQGAGAGGGGVGGGGGSGAGSGNGAGGAFGNGGLSSVGAGGGGGFGGGGGWCGAPSGVTGGFGGFGGGGGGGFSSSPQGRGGFGGGAGRSPSGNGGGGAGMGGAIFNHAGTLSLVNTTLSGNSANGGAGAGASNPGRDGSGLGGAIFNLNGTVSVNFSTIANNSIARTSADQGPGDGAGIYSVAIGNRIADGAASVALLTLSNSLVTGNTAANGASANQVVNFRGSGSNTNAAQLRYVGANLIGSVNNNDDAQGPVPLADAITLGALADNGGDTPTLALPAGSAAIDAGVGCASAQPATDQRGLARVWPDTPDLGAYEYGAPSGPGEVVFHDNFEGVVACRYAALVR